MIVFRYLIRQILVTMSAVAGVLLLVIMGSRFIRYFTDAANGDIPARLLGSLMLFHMPSFLELVLPLALFLGVLLAYGQLYLNSEMTVLTACGVSRKRLLRVTLWPGALVAMMVAACSLWLTPMGLAQNERLITAQQQQADFSALTPGRFQEIGDRTIYTERVTRNSSRLEHVFVAETQQRDGQAPEQIVTRADSGYQTNDPDTGSRFLVLSNGERYVVTPGQAVGDRLQFDTYAVRQERTSVTGDIDDEEMLSTLALWRDGSDKAISALQWRVSLVVMVPILILMALPLSRVNPRSGRFAKLVPAIILHMSYLSLLLAAQNALAKGQLPAWIGMWPIHALYLVIGIFLFTRGRPRRRRHV
ncbi:LPS export ABC transporter permease LptF [Larsenimonas suaedae]|uniref:Lipopolysaccharide export system permease protein LptF n=1 Tax=Larsenimonas suaedae TaxID=1851019 RepID=A0ABU1GTD4_9GAMM|nr:LPS export ABC transporter permease LptF [Larsenimonas suaedae]MCM2972116.1 LPS export ABC transporter permease LptF [Larsenimonas suaedae]MDR5895090.1 LPS export ABC transporter permease LptF [Larsenimonas suaedae]